MPERTSRQPKQSPQQLLEELARMDRQRRYMIEHGSHSHVLASYTARIKALNKQLKRLGVDPGQRR